MCVCVCGGGGGGGGGVVLFFCRKSCGCNSDLKNLKQEAGKMNNRLFHVQEIFSNSLYFFFL